METHLDTLLPGLFNRSPSAFSVSKSHQKRPVGGCWRVLVGKYLGGLAWFSFGCLRPPWPDQGHLLVPEDQVQHFFLSPALRKAMKDASDRH